MITCIVYDSCREELNMFKDVMHDEAAYLTSDEWELEFFESQEKFFQSFRQMRNLDIICLDITDSDILELLGQIRKYYDKSMLLVIANLNISPMEYLRPSIHPDALLLRPFTGQKLRDVIKELLNFYMEQTYSIGNESCYMVETRAGKTIIPFSHISYFESRNKKIYVRAGRQEFGFYETIDHLANILPEEFIRCHRSFIVNKSKIRRVLLSQSVLELDNMDTIPISRSYRMEVKNI